MTSGTEHLFMCFFWLCVYLSSLDKYLPESFIYLKNKQTGYFIIEFDY